MEGKMFVNVKDITELLGVSVSKAYKIIHTLNEELEKKGYITVRGKVSRKYFEERVGI